MQTMPVGLSTHAFVNVWGQTLGMLTLCFLAIPMNVSRARWNYALVYVLSLYSHHWHLLWPGLVILALTDTLYTVYVIISV